MADRDPLDFLSAADGPEHPDPQFAERLIDSLLSDLAEDAPDAGAPEVIDLEKDASTMKPTSKKWLFPVLAAAAAIIAIVSVAIASSGSDSGLEQIETEQPTVVTPQLTWGGTDSDLVGKAADDLAGDCTFAGPTEVRDGVVVIEFVNTSDDNANIVVMKIDEGHTADELAEHFADPAVAAFPPWANTDMGTGGVLRAEPGETTAWEAVFDAGEYGLLCSQRSVRAQPWFGSGLTVVEG